MPGARVKNTLVRVLGICVLVAGLLTISYPYISDWLNKQAMEAVRNTQEVAVAAASTQDLSAHLQAARDYNTRLAAGQALPADPFTAQANEGSVEYDALLNLAGDGVMGSIHIPSVNVSLPIYHGVAETTLEHGAGHLPGTSLPVGGETTHAVITGHTGLPSGKFFDDIDRLQVGDWFVVEVLGETLAYEVESIDVVLPEEVDTLGLQPGRDLVTLVTCTPYGVNSHRLLVHAARIDVPEEWWAQSAAQPVLPNVFYPRPAGYSYALYGALAALVIVGVVLVIKRLRKHT